MQHSQGKEVKPPGENNPVTWELKDCCQQARQPRVLLDFTRKKMWGFMEEVGSVIKAKVGKTHPRALGPLGDSAV